jgi:surface antigen
MNPPEFDAIFAAAAARHHISAGLLRAIASVESGFRPGAVGPWVTVAGRRTHALGMMQMLPETFSAYGGGSPFDPAAEVEAAAAMLERDGASQGPDGVRRAVYAYNHDWGYVGLVTARQRSYELAAPEADASSWPWGQCTWFVATKRRVTWGGNAADWLRNARAKGLPTSSTPTVGAIAVYRPGHGYDPVAGHVALVVGVGADTYVVMEANVRGVGWVDFAQKRLNDPGLAGFIG